MTRSPLCPSEHVEQVLVLKWCDAMSHRVPDLMWVFAVPNGARTTMGTAKKLKAEGLKSGYPDLGLDVARGGYFGLRIEMKRQSGGVISPAQHAWHDRLREQGYRMVVCKGAELAQTELLAYCALPLTLPTVAPDKAPHHP